MNSTGTFWSSIGPEINRMLSNNQFVDMMVVCEGRRIVCHKLVLAACSPFFENILNDHPPGQFPIIILSNDVKYWMIQSLMEFMYTGECNVTAEVIGDLVKCAENLQIRCLSGQSSIPEGNQQLPTPRATRGEHQPVVDVIALSDDEEEKSTVSLSVSNTPNRRANGTNQSLVPTSSSSVSSSRITSSSPPHSSTATTKASSSSRSAQVREDVNQGSRDDLLAILEGDDNSTDYPIERALIDSYDLRPGSAMRPGYYNEMDTEDERNASPPWSFGSNSPSPPPEEGPRRKHSRPRRPNGPWNYTMKDVDAALEKVRNGMSLSFAAHLHNLPSGTLYNHAKRRRIIPTDPQPKKIQKRRKTHI